MIRQTITEEQILNMTDDQKLKLASIIHPKQKWQEWVWSDTAKLVTIGVLQGLLLDAGYTVTIEPLEALGFYIVNIRKDEDSFQGNTLEPIDVLLKAVLTLVIGD